MVNLKHAISAIAAVAMVGSLAAKQAAEITSVNAQKTTAEITYNQPEVLAGDGEGVVEDSPQTSKLISQNEPEIEKAENTAEDTTEEIKEEIKEENNKAYVLITEAFLNLRADASTDAEVVAQLECAAEVTILSETDEWYQVEYGDKTGYVAKRFITKSYDEAKAAMLENFKYESGYINADGVNIRDNAGTEGTMIIDQAGKDTLIFVIERVNDEWMKVYYGKNYDVGYVMSSFVTIDDAVSKDDVASAKTNRINAIAKMGQVSSGGASLNVRALPDEKSEIVDTLQDGASVKIITRGSKWTKIAVGNSGKTAYVKTEYILDEEQLAAKKAAEEEKRKKEAEQKAAEQAKKKASSNTAAKTTAEKSSSKSSKKASESTSKSTSSPTTGSGSGQAIVNAAAKYIGTKYVYGGNSPVTGFDCSGLVQYACKQAGISVNRSSRAQYSNGRAVSRSDLQPGDLVFFSKGSGISHVVIYAGNGQVIHSPSPGKSVCYTSLSNICSYSTYVGARRVAG